MGSSVRILVTIAFLVLLSPDTPLILVYALMLVAGVYNSQHTVVNSAAPQIQIRQSIRLQANSVIQVMQNFGSSIGMVVYMNMIGTQGIVDGMHTAFILAIALAVVGFVFCLFLKKLEPET
jgi:MFS family permease